MKCWKKVSTLFSSNKHPLKNSRKEKQLLESHEMSFFHVMPLHTDNGHHDPVVIITMTVIFNKNKKIAPEWTLIRKKTLAPCAFHFV